MAAQAFNDFKPTFDDVRHVAIYLRISQEKRGENVETLENHRQILYEFCKENGYTYEEYGEVISSQEFQHSPLFSPDLFSDRLQRVLHHQMFFS